MNLIVFGALWVLVVLTLPETKATILIQRRAKRKRKKTGDDRYYAPGEKEPISYGWIFIRGLKLPFRLLLLEPIGEFSVFEMGTRVAV